MMQGDLFEEDDDMGGRQGILPFEFEEDGPGAKVTAYGGLTFVLEMMRALDVDKSIEKNLHTRKLKRGDGFTDRELVEGCVLMLAAGGEHCDDMTVLMDDVALQEILGQEFASPAVLKQFLYRFHDDAMDEEISERRKKKPSYVAEETKHLKGLGKVNVEFIHEVDRRNPVPEATLDLDASIIESDKREAAWTYKYVTGYQPTLVVWAEKDLIVADEFRDGNVPAQSGVLRVLKEAVAALPKDVKEINFRSDSAAYQHKVMGWCNKDIPGRPPVTFAISADMSPKFKHAIQVVPEPDWNQDPDDPFYEWAEVPYVPSQPYEKKDSKPNRYLAIRITPRQRDLFADGSEVKHFGVVTNDWKRNGLEIIKWHRKKAGTIEHVNHVLKNELGAGVLPCSRFHANAAWLRLNVLTYNVLSALKQLILPKQLKKARPKALRFHMFATAAQVIHHARKITVRLAEKWRQAGWLEFPNLRRQLLVLARC